MSPLLLDQPKRMVLGVLNHLLESMDARCPGFVLMPDHVHALVWLSDPGDIIRFLHGWKRMSSFRIRGWPRLLATWAWERHRLRSAFALF